MLQCVLVRVVVQYAELEYHLRLQLSHVSSHGTHLLLVSLSRCKTGEEREEWKHDSSSSSATSFNCVAPCKAPVHTNSFASDLQAKEPQSRDNGNNPHSTGSTKYSGRCHSTGSAKYSRHCLSTQPPQRQPQWQRGGPQQVSLSNQTTSTNWYVLHFNYKGALGKKICRVKSKINLVIIWCFACTACF